MKKMIRNWLDGQDFKHGLVQGFIVCDQFLNWAFSPFSKETWADETLSARCGRLGHRNPYKFWVRIIDALFFWQGPNHCANAHIKERERKNYQSPDYDETPPVK